MTKMFDDFMSGVEEIKKHEAGEVRLRADRRDDGMKRERLMELREETAQYRAVADDRCMSTQYEDDILALIDAEIARQSVTDEAVQRAIEWAEQERKNSFRYMDFGDADSASLAITALRQMKPDLYLQAGNDPEADDWANGYSRGYADGLQAHKKTSDDADVAEIIATGEYLYGLNDDNLADLVIQTNEVQNYIVESFTALRQYQKPSGSTSDGYHTFNELYHHRAVLFSALCYAYKDKAWRAKKHHDGSMFGDDWFICGVETPQGQYTYHYHISECWDLFDFCKTLDNAPEWDGHQPKDVDRLLSLRQMRTEPCEICGNFKHIECKADNLEFTAVRCPNCGKELVK